MPTNAVVYGNSPGNLVHCQLPLISSLFNQYTGLKVHEIIKCTVRGTILIHLGQIYSYALRFNPNNFILAWDALTSVIF